MQNADRSRAVMLGHAALLRSLRPQSTVTKQPPPCCCPALEDYVLKGALCQYSVRNLQSHAAQVLLAAGGGNLIYLEMQEGRLIETAHKQLDQEIACLDLTSTGAP